MRCIAVWAGVLAAFGQVQPVPAPSQAARKRPAEIRSLVERVPLAPPELGAEILLHLIEANAITDRDWEIELLDDAFQLARKAKYPLPITPAVPRAGVGESDIGTLWLSIDQ